MSIKILKAKKKAEPGKFESIYDLGGLGSLKEAKLTKKERAALSASLRASKQKFERHYPDDLTGFRFGKLVVLRKIIALPEPQKALWDCVTDCSSVTQATTDDLISGRAKDCDFRPSPPKRPK